MRLARARWSIVLPVVVLLWYAWQTDRAVGTWRSDVTLWGQAVAVSPTHLRATRNLAKALWVAGHEDEALALYATTP